MENIIKLTSRFDKINETLAFDSGDYLLETINFREKCVIDALIRLGWTPPKKSDVKMTLPELLWIFNTTPGCQKAAEILRKIITTEVLKKELDFAE